MNPTLLSLFAGIGGIDLAAERAGFSILGQVEIDDYCTKILEKHWPAVPKWRDITTVTASDILAATNGIVPDIIAGGFPCQDISIAGRKKGVKEGTRSGLWFEFARLIGDLQPRFVLLENVYNILNLDGTTVVNDLAALGYDCEWGIIRASDAGAPHTRKRWFCVAYRRSERRGEQQLSRRRTRRVKAVRCGQALAYASRRRHQRPTPAVKLPRYRQWDTEARTGLRRAIASPSLANRQVLGNAQSKGLQRANGQQLERHDTTRPIIGQVEPIMGRAIDGLSRRMDDSRWPCRPDEPQHGWERPRVITEREPHHKDRLKALGNAVVPQVVEPILRLIYEELTA